MSIKISHAPDYTVITYIRESYLDVDALKKMLARLALSGSEVRDIVLDFSASDFIVSSEIRMIVNLLKSLQKSSAALHCIIAEKNRKILLSGNLDRAEGLFMYDTIQQFHSKLPKSR
jgi:MFS superfamily sulfate permease-like transporter